MFFADCHTHSSCSPDGSIPMAEMARTAVQYGLSCLTLTDHCDLLSLEGAPTPTFDWAPLRAQRTEMLARYGTQLDLPYGLEFGCGHLDPAASDKILSEPGLDFVIGSVHNLSPAAGGKDFYFVPYESTEDCVRALDDYFASLLVLAAGPYYDVMGHIIYPLRYMTGDFDRPDLRRWRDEIHEILRLAAESGRGIEINTWKGQTLGEWLPILREFRSVGGEFVTVGSDAHATEPIGRGVRAAYQMMQDCGFRYAAVYHERKPDMYKLD